MSISGSAFELGRQVTQPLPPVFDGVSDRSVASLLAEVRELAAQANRIEARRCALLSQVYALRDQQRSILEETNRLFVGDWDELVAEVGAALQVGRGAAGAAVHRALDLRERLPQVFELFGSGRISLTLARVVLRYARAILDDHIAHAYDARIAAWLAGTTADPDLTLTAAAVEEASRTIMVEIDRDAIPHQPEPTPAPRIDFHSRNDGTVDLEAVLPKADAIRLSAMIAEVARTVCRRDGRPLAERQVTALIALAEGYTSLGCHCRQEGCAHAERTPRSGAVAPDMKALAVIVLAESDAAHAESAGAPPAAPAEPPDGAPTPRRGAVVLCEDLGISGPVTVEQANALIAQCDTTVRPLGRRDPATGRVHATGASGYTPTRYQLLVMRLRYPTCTFPGCSVSSALCQADHVAEYDHRHPERGGGTTVAGAAGPGNLVPLCGFHHRIKTETSWLSDVLDDGTVVWTHPAAGTRTVAPSTSSSLLPGLASLTWDTPTGVPRCTGTSDDELGTTGSTGGRGPREPAAQDLDRHASRRAASRRAARARNRRIRTARCAQRAAERAQRLQELLDQQRRRAEQAGEPPPPDDPPF
ncbi:hypothetical protein GCM10027289_19600 [Tsukamurella serpentis]